MKKTYTKQTEKKQREEMCKKLKRKHQCFSRQEVMQLMQFYTKAVTPEYSKIDESENFPKMDRSKFRCILTDYFNITDDILMDRVFRVFDKDNDGYISMEEWVAGFGIFLRGQQDERIKFCFEVYDLNNDGAISREEMFQLLKSCFQHKFQKAADDEEEESVKELVEISLKKLSSGEPSSKGFVTLDEYLTGIKGEPLLIEAFGQILPTQESVTCFFEELENNYGDN